MHVSYLQLILSIFFGVLFDCFINYPGQDFPTIILVLGIGAKETKNAYWIASAETITIFFVLLLTERL